MPHPPPAPRLSVKRDGPLRSDSCRPGSPPRAVRGQVLRRYAAAHSLVRCPSDATRSVGGAGGVVAPVEQRGALCCADDARARGAVLWCVATGRRVLSLMILCSVRCCCRFAMGDVQPTGGLLRHRELAVVCGSCLEAMCVVGGLSACCAVICHDRYAIIAGDRGRDPATARRTV